MDKKAINLTRRSLLRTSAGLALGGAITEMRPGTYIYGDANQVTIGSQRLEDCALTVVATVVSTPTQDRAVVDA